jgi:hypothetical protein
MAASLKYQKGICGYGAETSGAGARAITADRCDKDMGTRSRNRGTGAPGASHHISSRVIYPRRPGGLAVFVAWGRFRKARSAARY